MPKHDRERKTVEAMIAMYCRDRHHTKNLCPDCTRLRDYAFKKLDQCRFGDTKPPCSDCSVHCYNPEYKAGIKAVMRYAGPRMITRHPIMAIRYFIDKRSKRR